jgi:hypothetical protein
MPFYNVHVKTRAYKNKRILIFSDSQAALSGLKVTSGLVAECSLYTGRPE